MPGQRRTKTAIVLAYVAVFWIVLPYSLWSLAALLDNRFSWQLIPVPVGWLLLGAALAFMVWSMRVLWRQGQGLPIGALPPRLLATQGPYALVRHPIYLGFQVALFGAGLASGSRALTLLVAPGFLPCWLLYAWFEERRLLSRFGASYQRYRRRVGMFPRPWYRLAWLVARLLLKVRTEDRPRIRGPFVLVANHSCYLDPFFLMACFRRPVRFLITAEAYRNRVLAHLLVRAGMAPVRRYRVDPLAGRRLLEFLAAGEIVGIFPEGERSPLGCYQGTLSAPAGILARLDVPIVPAGIVGAYDAGPRWSGVLRRRTVTVRFGPPIVFRGRAPEAAIDAALGALLDSEVRLHLEGLPRERLYRVLWACPRCLHEVGWSPAELSCATCGAHYLNTPEGQFRDEEGAVHTFEELGRALTAGIGEGDTFAAAARGFCEANMTGPIRPLIPISGDRLVVDRQGITFDGVRLPLDRVRSVTTERADTLQVASDQAMWQFRPEGLSVFRLKAALDVWMSTSELEDVNEDLGQPQI